MVFDRLPKPEEVLKSWKVENRFSQWVQDEARTLYVIAEHGLKWEKVHVWHFFHSSLLRLSRSLFSPFFHFSWDIHPAGEMTHVASLKFQGKIKNRLKFGHNRRAYNTGFDNPPERGYFCQMITHIFHIYFSSCLYCLKWTKFGQLTFRKISKLLIPDVRFLGENALNSISTGASPQTPLGQLTALPDLWLNLRCLLLRWGRRRKWKGERKELGRWKGTAEGERCCHGCWGMDAPGAGNNSFCV